jgi:colanic acid biosynthesis glycosyl transferase WcaI
VTTITPAMKARLEEKKLNGKDIPVIPNWIDKDRIFPLPGPSQFRLENAIPADAIVALYSGSLVTKQGLELVVDAARKLAADADIYFVICGDGPLKDSLVEAAKDLPRVRFLPLQPADRLNELLNAADIHLLAQAPGASDLVMPSKLGPMMASGRPVVAAVDPDGTIARMIEGAGLLVPVRSSTNFANAIRELADAPERRHAMGAVGRQTVIHQLDRESVMARTVAILQALIKPAPRNPEPGIEVKENLAD